MADEKRAPSVEESVDNHDSEIINSSGHVQELDRKFGFWAVCGSSVAIDNAWGSGGSALILALYNGGGPGVLYGLIASTFFYCFIGACLAELSSALPSSANVYHWASVTPGPRFGRICSWYAGWFNCLSWIFGSASPALAAANTIMSMYSLYRPDFVPQRWQIFITYILVVWLTMSTVLFGQRILARYTTAAGTFCLLLLFIVTLTCAIYPSTTGVGYASNASVWGDFQNLTGWSSPGFVFLAGMLNGAFAIGTPDGVCHLAEEIPNPRVNIPKGIVAQLATGFLSTFVFYIAILYGVTSISSILSSTTALPSLPLAAMFGQITQSRPATLGLLILFLFDLLIALPGAWLAASRILWTLARDDATPAARWVGRVSPTWRNPFNASLVCASVATALGAIYVGSPVAFNTFLGAFTILTTMSYLLAILPHILTGRKYLKPGPFWMPGWIGIAVGAVASAYIILFNVIYMFPYSLPVTVENMNYECVMVGGLTIFITIGYLFKRRTGYTGPHVAQEAQDNIMKGTIGIDRDVQQRRAHAFAEH